MHHKPLLPFSGLTIILSEKSRFDTTELISGPAGELLKEYLKPLSRYSCDIRLADCLEPFIKGTKVILLMGNYAKSRFIPENTLNETRGYCYQLGSNFDSVVYIPTYTPQDCLDRRNYSEESEWNTEDEDDSESGMEKEHSPTKRKNYKFWFYHDIQKAVKLATGIEQFNPLRRNRVNSHNIGFNIFYPSNDIIHQLENTRNSVMFFDIETNENYNITVFSFSFCGKTIWTVPFIRHTGLPAYGEIQLCKILRALAVAFKHNRVVIHNSLFDLFILCWRYRIPPPLDIFDTMICWHRLFPEVEKSLGHVLSVTTQEQFHKNDGIFNPHDKEQESRLWTYNAVDVLTMAKAYWWIVAEAEKANLTNSLAEANKLIRPYLLMSLQGILIDNEKKTSELNKLERLQKQYLRIANKLIGYDIETLGSWQRIAKYLYTFKRYPKPPPVYENGKVKYPELTASVTLYKLLCKHDIPFVKLLLYYRSISKEAGFLKFSTFNNGRFTTAYNISGTNTFRLASRKLFSTWGSNAQNIKKKQRQILIADPGKVLVQTDQAGAEAVIVAYLAPKGNYRLLIENGIKAHVFVALHVFADVWAQKLGINIKPFIEAKPDKLKLVEGWKQLDSLIKESDNWPAQIRYYYIAKMIVHASSYGMRGPTFQINVLKKSEGTIVISKQEADFYLGTFHNIFPEIRQWQCQTREQLQNNRTLYNLFGDRRVFHGYLDDTTFREAYAFVPQSTVGVLTSRAIAEIQGEIDKGNEEYKNFDCLLNCHDAIIGQCPEGMQKELAKVQEKHLGKYFKIREDSSFIMKSESNYGKNWYEMEKV